MKKEIGRRDLIGRAGLALGGLATLGALQACGSEDDPAPAAQPQVADFPYEQHLSAGYQLDVDAVKEAAYHAYYAGGCCHGAYSALLGHLAQTAGAPFDKLPLDFGKFGGGGVASYGSICGALLGSVLIVNSIVPAPTGSTARAAMMTDLMRWYEGFAFPEYTPAAVDAAETGTTLFGSPPSFLAIAPGAHLCHSSVSKWCASQTPIVSATGADKKARCARLTADVAGKAAELLNAYLASGAYGARTYAASQAMDVVSTGCVGCHTGGTTARPPVASGMACDSCHSDKTTNHPALP